MSYVDALAHEGRLLVAVVRRLDPAAPVPTCAGWTVADLAGHVGRVHRWATTVVQTGRETDEGAPVPADDALADWLEEGLESLAAGLDGNPDRPCWTFTGARTVRWWQRRQALETLIHRTDAERAGGGVSAVDALLASDGIAEVVDVLHPRQVRLGRCGPPATQVELTTSDVGTVATIQGPTPPVAVEGPAEALLLLLWSRTTPDDASLRVRGDRRRLELVLSGPLTP